MDNGLSLPPPSLRDNLFKLSGDLTLSQNLPLSPSAGEVDSCKTQVMSEGRMDQLDYECGNHIRVYRKFPNVSEFSAAQGRMLVCGSYALDPHCVTVDIVSRGCYVDVREGWERGCVCCNDYGMIVLIPGNRC